MAKIKTPDKRRCFHYSEKIGCKHLPKDCDGFQFSRYCYNIGKVNNVIVENPERKRKF